MAFSPNLAPLPRPGSRFLLACLGASAGGLPAYRQLLGALPAGAPLALVAVNHARDRSRNLLPGALRGHSALPVLEVEPGMPIELGHLYVIPAGRDLTLSPEGTAFEVHPVAKAHGWPRAITVFLDALAQRWPGEAAAVILSGLGADGADALCRVRATGGWVFAQAPQTAAYPDMPHQAILTGCVDGVLPPEQIGRELLRLATEPSGGRRPR
jgi:chemotaxis response regulator CheB